MEKISKYSWALVGVKSHSGDQLPDEEVEKMLNNTFTPERIFNLFLCVAFVDKSGTLEEMESGLDLIIREKKDYTPGEFCIVANHEQGMLLFLPISESDENKSISGDSDPVQG